MRFSEARRRGFLQRVSRFGSIIGGWSYLGGCRNSIAVSFDKTIKLHAVRLFGSENNEYSVTLTISDSNGITLATKTDTFMSQLTQCERGNYPARI